MFDLGIRRDERTYPPRVQKAYASMRETGPVEFTVDQEAHEKLPAKGVPLESIEAVIWRYASAFFSVINGLICQVFSHRHIDHIGECCRTSVEISLVDGV